jgi:hypothetical protein
VLSSRSWPTCAWLRSAQRGRVSCGSFQLRKPSHSLAPSGSTSTA